MGDVGRSATGSARGRAADGPASGGLVPQGHDAHDPEILTTTPAADLTVEHIGDLVDYDLSTLRGRAGAGVAAEPGQRR